MRGVVNVIQCTGQSLNELGKGPSSFWQKIQLFWKKCVGFCYAGCINTVFIHFQYLYIFLIRKNWERVTENENFCPRLIRSGLVPIIRTQILGPTTQFPERNKSTFIIPRYLYPQGIFRFKHNQCFRPSILDIPRWFHRSNNSFLKSSAEVFRG